MENILEIDDACLKHAFNSLQSEKSELESIRLVNDFLEEEISNDDLFSAIDGFIFDSNLSMQEYCSKLEQECNQISQISSTFQSFDEGL